MRHRRLQRPHSFARLKRPGKGGGREAANCFLNRLRFFFLGSELAESLGKLDCARSYDRHWGLRGALFAQRRA